MRDGSLLERLDSSDVAHVQDRMAYLLSLRERLEARRNGVQLQRAALQQRARAVQEDVAGLASDVTALSRALEGRRAMLDNFRRRADELDQLSEAVARTASALSAELHNDDHWATPLSRVVQRETGQLDESATAAELAAAAERMRRRGLESRPAGDSMFRRLQVRPPQSPTVHHANCAARAQAVQRAKRPADTAALCARASLRPAPLRADHPDDCSVCLEPMVRAAPRLSRALMHYS